MSDERPSIAELQKITAGTGDLSQQTALIRADVNQMILEIVAAALALRDQEQVAAKARYRVYSTLNKNAVPSDENYAAAGDEDRKLATCRETYRVALAKVRS